MGVPIPAMGGLGSSISRLPHAHFTGALAFLAAMALSLPFVAPDLAAGRFLMPRVVAATHMLTLGWITMSIMGALCQLFPVVLGAPLRWPRLAWLGLALFAPGLAVFVASLFLNAPRFAVHGATCFAAGLILFVVNVIATLQRVKTRDVTWWTLLAAAGFLLATIAFGASLAVNLENGHLGADRVRAISVHVHVALGGWVLLVVIAVARRLMPMFLLSHGAAESGWKRASRLLVSGAGILTLCHGFMTPWLFTGAALLLAAGAAVFVFTAASQFRARRRPKLDPGLRVVGAGVLLLAIATATGLTLLVPGVANPTLVTAYGIALVPGAFTLFVLGHYYKIVPFLTWNRVYAGMAGRVATPRVSDLYDARMASICGALVISGIALLLAGVAAGSARLALGGAGAYAAGAIGAAAQLGPLLWKGKSHGLP